MTNHLLAVEHHFEAATQGQAYGRHNHGKRRITHGYDGALEIIQKRIARRAIDAEQVIEADYLNALRDGYHRIWASYTDAPVYVLNTAELNYVDNPEDRKTVIEMVQGWLNSQPIPGSPASLQSEREVQPSLFGPGL